VDLLEKAKGALSNRQGDYTSVFDLNSEAAVAVLMDLAKFCRAHESTFHADPRIHALMEGRREVWLRIAEHLNLDMDTLWSLYGEGRRRMKR